MSESTESRIIELFNEKMAKIDEKFDAEAKKRRTLMNVLLSIFGGTALIFIFSAGIIVQKVNSLEQNYYKVSEKVETLYMVAVQQGNIDPAGNPRGSTVNKGGN